MIWVDFRPRPPLRPPFPNTRPRSLRFFNINKCAYIEAQHTRSYRTQDAYYEEGQEEGMFDIREARERVKMGCRSRSNHLGSMSTRVIKGLVACAASAHS